MRVLVTGGAGFIGSHIVDLLIQEGHSVTVVDNLITGKRVNVNPRATFYQMDILDAQLSKVFEQESPEVVFHQAALVYVQQSIQDPISDGRSNVMGTLNVLHTAYLHKVSKVIYASSCAVYGETQSKIITEKLLAQPISFYGASKYMGEIYVQLFNKLFNLDYTILRYANVYGPRQIQHGEGGVIPIFIQKMQQGILPTIFGDGNQTRDFIYVKDVAKANVLAMQKGSKRTYNIATGVETTINDLYQKLAQIMRVDFPVLYRPEKLGDVKHCCPNSHRAKKELAWKPSYSLETGLMETVQFYRP